MKLPLFVAELEQGTLHFQKALQLKYEFISQKHWCSQNHVFTQSEFSIIF